MVRPKGGLCTSRLSSLSSSGDAARAGIRHNTSATSRRTRSPRGRHFIWRSLRWRICGVLHWNACVPKSFERHRFEAGHHTPQEAVCDPLQDRNTGWEHVCRVSQRQPFSYPWPRSRQPTGADHRQRDIERIGQARRTGIPLEETCTRGHVLESTTGFIVSPASRSKAAAPGGNPPRSASARPARARPRRRTGSGPDRPRERRARQRLRRSARSPDSADRRR